MAKLQYTKEDIAWAKEKIIPLCDNNPTPHTLEVKNAMGLYKKRLGRTITLTGLSTWLRRVQDPARQKAYDKAYRERLKSGLHVPRAKKNPAAIFEKSNFIVVVGHNIAGFDKEAEVKEFLANSQILNGIKLFVNTPIKVKYKVSIG